MANKKPANQKNTTAKTAPAKFDWNKRLGKKQGTEDYVKPALSWGLFGGTLALATVIGLIVIL